VNGHERGDVGHHELEEDLGIGGSELSSQMGNAMLSGELMSDASQPEEFRETWGAILSAYVGSSEQVSAYLQSAFRAVSESAMIYKTASRSIDAVRAELAQTAAAGIEHDAAALLTEAGKVRDEVKAASAELEAAIKAAAQAGRGGTFDRALEDVVNTALRRLMAANEQLLTESEALSAVAALLKEARAGNEAVDQAQVAATVSEARAEARAEIAIMRKSWDRAAQNVLSAFMARLATERGGENSSEGPGVGGA